MVEAMLKAVLEFATLGCKWKVFKKGFSHAQRNAFQLSTSTAMALINVTQGKNGFLRNAMVLRSA